MKRSLGLRCLAALLMAVGFALPAVVGQQADRKIDFEKDVAPIFQARCYECHGPKKQESGFRLDLKSAAMKGGDNGLVIVPGKSSESLLIQAIEGRAETVSRMPEKGEPLSAYQIAIL